MTKKLSDIQWQGRKGEKAFEYWAELFGLLATKLDPDEGIDYVCQVMGDRTEKASHAMTGDFVAVWVRGSDKQDPKVQITHEDASCLLAANLPVVLVLVDLNVKSDLPSFYARVLDVGFVRELAVFVRGRRRSRTLRVGSCVSGNAEISAAIRAMLVPGMREQLDALKRELRVQEVIPGASYKGISSQERALSLVHLPNFWSQFEAGNEAAKAVIDRAVFGRQDFFAKRATGMPLRADLLSALRYLPSPVVIGGPAFVEGGQVRITARDNEGDESCMFEIRRHDGWTGYCHSSGLALRISDAVERDGQSVHMTESIVDPDTEVSDVLESDLPPFLKHARGEAKISFGDGLQLPAQHFPLLNVLGWLCEYAVSLREECPLDFSDWKVNQVQEEDLQSLRVLRELCRTPGSLDGFGFSVGDFPHDQLVRRPVVFALPLCMNFRGEGVVCWLLADGEHLVEPNENMVVGVRIMRTDSVTTEKAQRSFPTEGLPKIKICSDWPGIDLYSPAQSFTWSGPDDWGVELQSQPPAGDE